ncbi:DUF2306 domain-containing protein [Pedobacter vanadiisoli]|uniref:DUF2306 domain-containing protein n=1 Tax=Pedobacter vanadiisoli TaxID=1761975 RepID=A0ABW5MIK9_9SPHI
MVKKGLWVLFAILATLIGLYPIIYFLVDRKFGLLNSKSVELLANTFWNIGFYTHIIFGGIALLTGWTQFSPKMRNRRMALHRKLGKVYVIAVLLSALAGIYIGFFATGGLISSTGFICLGIIWFYTTLKAYLYIKRGEIEKHQKAMVYSYAACFAAVTLRIWLPILTMLYGNFSKAYLVVAWLSWVPNLLVAYLLTRKKAVNE